MGHSERYARPAKERSAWIKKNLTRAFLFPLQWPPPPPPPHDLAATCVATRSWAHWREGSEKKNQAGRGRLLSCRHKNCWKIFTISPILDFLLLLTWQILTLEILTEFQVLWKYLNGL
nr:hypothetical protein [Morchella crassipes]